MSGRLALTRWPRLRRTGQLGCLPRRADPNGARPGQGQKRSSAAFCCAFMIAQPAPAPPVAVLAGRHRRGVLVRSQLAPGSIMPRRTVDLTDQEAIALGLAECAHGNPRLRPDPDDNW
jgi:hypothetical protein